MPLLETERLQIQIYTVTVIIYLHCMHSYMLCRKFPNGYVTVMAVGQSQRLYSGAGIFNWYYPSSLPRYEYELPWVALLWY